MSDKRLKELDMLRAVAFIFVIEQHTLGGAFDSTAKSNFNYYCMIKLFYTMAQPAVQIFLCISAISLFYVYSKKFNFKKYYSKRLVYIYIPYILWSLIYIFYKKNFNHIFMQIVTGNSEYHLWYMGMILRLFLYFPIILWLARKIHKQNIVLRISVFIVLMVSYYKILKYNYLITTSITNFIFKNPSSLQQRFINITPLVWIGYFIIGIYIALYYEKFKYIVLKFKSVIITIYISLFTYEYLLSIYVISTKGVGSNFKVLLSLLYCVFTILFMYIVSCSLSNKARIYDMLNFISKYSYTAYMAQIIVLNYFYSNLTWHFNIKTHYLTLHLITWVAVCFLAPLLIKIISCIPYTGFITGIKTKKYNLLEFQSQFVQK